MQHGLRNTTECLDECSCERAERDRCTGGNYFSNLISPLSSSYRWICFFISSSISFDTLLLFSSAICSIFDFIASVVLIAMIGFVLVIINSPKM